MDTIAEPWMWLSFLGFMAVMIAIDLYLVNSKPHRTTTKEALCWTALWFLLAITFDFLLWWYVAHTTSIPLANEKALEFFTSYLLEKSLSIDNLFVFFIIFNYFSVPAEYQKRVLMIGVIGAILLRLIMITLGIYLVIKIHWILYVFGLFLLVMGIEIFISSDQHPELEKNRAVQWMYNHLRITERFNGEKFFIRQNNLLFVTPLFLVLILIEITDIIFAIDSIPAVFAVTEDPFIVFTSNIFAILGLRALYFLLSTMAERFYLIKYGIAIILVFVGFKMLSAPWLKIHNSLVLGLVVITLGSCIYASYARTKKAK